MLGTRYGASLTGSTYSEQPLRRYNIEPFFFTSSVNWIPSRYQESASHGEGDRQSKTSGFKDYILMCAKTLLLPCLSYEHCIQHHPMRSHHHSLHQLYQHEKDHNIHHIHLWPRTRKETRSILRLLFICRVCVMIPLHSRYDVRPRWQNALHRPPCDPYGPWCQDKHYYLVSP